MAKPKKTNIDNNKEVVETKEQEPVVDNNKQNEEIIIVDDNGQEYTEKELDEKENAENKAIKLFFSFFF